ncbi:Glycoside hydrolase family 16 protein [Pyrenophora tritici-repentis]|nr:Glyco-hydro-16 domain containing protein [Pyrenophora tritici-repentis]KAG9384211.1 Glycoside hydrolase family 16 protein [Pyrenophora tritici-repentis]KAI1538480.1 Glycoside hydrolase family 16 protein [Pyrenophora tritici-repentis]KAI1540699.1 Glycoside hydrolase family 16 protein [Pyrenophora tritici-repentis]KAI1552642.1 Glycoside hydrolase family 16 protein [Pyrenophora tritici-repentis]
MRRLTKEEEKKKQDEKDRDYFKSRRVRAEDVQMPWLDEVCRRTQIKNGIVIVGFILGVMACGLVVWHSMRDVGFYHYCEAYHDNFTSWNDSVWTKEVELGGFGNGQFEMTTATDENVYLENDELVIKPTLQDEKLIMNNTTIMDLRHMGCTGSQWYDCYTGTNTTNGTIINPVKSGRINTKLGANIRYGRLEVVAKLPRGDWLWPAIWMLPKDNVYGPWPRSGEIDIAESRGNAVGYSKGGINYISSSLHFGPNGKYNGWWRNNVKRHALHTTFAADYNTFGIEWSEKYIFTYMNSRLLQVMYTKFKHPFYEVGQFPLSDPNGTRLDNPWADRKGNSAPFDQDFYLILSLGVGATNGWFVDGEAGKPWLDKNYRAKMDFWEARESWLPTWEDEGKMRIKSITMWQQKGYNGCGTDAKKVLSGSKGPLY